MAMSDKRGQGISITTVVIAAIALIVLVVVVLIFTGKLNIFGANAASCEAKQGKCGCYVEHETEGKVSFEFIILAEGESCSSKNGVSGCPEGYGILLRTDCNANKAEGDDLCCIPS